MKPPRQVFGMLLLALALLLAGANAALASGAGQMDATWRYQFFDGSLGPGTGVCGLQITVYATLLTDSGTGDASWSPAVGNTLKFGFSQSTTAPEPSSMTQSTPTDANGRATATIEVPASGAVTLWVWYSPDGGVRNYSTSIPFNIPGLTLAVSDATYDGHEHGAVATMNDSCGNAYDAPKFYYGREPTTHADPMTPPTNAGLYTAWTMYSIGPNHEPIQVYKHFIIAKAPAFVTPDSFTRQYSDQNPPLTGALSGFLDRDGVTVSYSTEASPKSAPREYPTEANRLPNATPGLGNYDVTYNTGTLVVVKEDAHVSFDPANPATLQASTSGGSLNAGALTLRVHVQELPDLPDGAAMAGDINKAELAVTLMPSTGPVLKMNCNPSAAGAGYEVRTFTCTNDAAIPVGAYEVSAAVTGDFYAGAGADVFTVDDPISGFATGGGWFSWPGAGEKTNFAFIAKPDKGGARLKGSLLVIRHHPDGRISRLKSTALDGLKLQNIDGCRIATFSGKGIYRTWNAAAGAYASSGGHAFTVYSEDCGKPGSGGDSFWIGGTGNLAMPAPAPGNKALLGGGNITVPHGGKQ